MSSGGTRGSWKQAETHLRMTKARRPNWKRLRTTRRKVSNTSSPLAEQPEKKIMMMVTPQRTVTARSSVL